jgi:hypothetical protein
LVAAKAPDPAAGTADILAHASSTENTGALTAGPTGRFHRGRFGGRSISTLSNTSILVTCLEAESAAQGGADHNPQPGLFLGSASAKEA